MGSHNGQALQSYGAEPVLRKLMFSDVVLDESTGGLCQSHRRPSQAGLQVVVEGAIGTCPAASYLVPSSVNGTRSISSMMQVNSGSTS